MRLLAIISILFSSMLTQGCGLGCGTEDPVGPSSNAGSAPTTAPQAMPHSFNWDVADGLEAWAATDSNVTLGNDTGTYNSGDASLVLSSPGDNSTSGTSRAWRAFSGTPFTYEISFSVNLDSLNAGSDPTVIEYIRGGIIIWQMKITGSGTALEVNGAATTCPGCTGTGWKDIVLRGSGANLSWVEFNGSTVTGYNTNTSGATAGGYPMTEGMIIYNGDGLHSGGYLNVDDLDIGLQPLP